MSSLKIANNEQPNEQQKDEQKKTEPSRRLLSSNSKKSSSFVAKHFNVQRRKTIHDSINIELFNSLTNTSGRHIANLSESTSRLSSTSSRKGLNMDNQNSILSTNNLVDNIDSQTTMSSCCNRELVKQGPVTLINVIFL